MIVVYADGGGLGHLTRVQALRHTLGLDDEVTVLTSSHHVDDERVVAGLHVVPIRIRRDDRAARRSWLQRTLAELDPDLFVVDAFPAGLAGEIDDATVDPAVTSIHVARLLRWPVYRRLVPDRPMRFHRTYLLEELDPVHHDLVTSVSDHVARLELIDPPLPATAPPDPSAGFDRPYWLVAHTGPSAEVVELVAYARDQADAEGRSPLLVVAAPRDVAPAPTAGLVVVDRVPVWPMFTGAERIITAAGFNTMRQLVAHRDRHRFLAMPRRFDDQVERARRARHAQAGGAGSVPVATTARPR